MVRFVYIVLLLGKYAFLFGLFSLGFYKNKKSKLIRAFFEEAGGAFIKFGQILALRIDVISKELALELLDLFDQFKPFPYEEVERIFVQELGTKPQKIFKHFEKTPFASASFAQVHAAKLTNGKTVVVKIQRPDIVDEVKIDFVVISVICFIADLFFRIDALPWGEFAKEFRLWTEKELDYHKEAETMQRMYMLNQSQHIADIVIPQIYHRLTTKKILVQEYLDGIPLSRILREMRSGNLTAEKLQQMGIDIKRTPRILVLEFFRQYFIDGFFHADPHPGNVLLLDDGRIGLVDFGIVGEAAPKRHAFIKFLEVGARIKYERDQFEKLGYFFLQFAGDQIEQIIGSALAANVNQKHIDGFMRLLGTHLNEYLKNIEMQMRKGLEVMKIDYTYIVLHILKFGHRYQIKLPNQMTVFIRALSIMGFLAKELNKDFVVSDVIIEFCKKYPVESLPKLDASVIPYQRLNREEAIDRLNNWLTYLMERDPKLYQLVNNYISQYTVG